MKIILKENWGNMPPGETVSVSAERARLLIEQDVAILAPGEEMPPPKEEKKDEPPPGDPADAEKAGKEDLDSIKKLAKTKKVTMNDILKFCRVEEESDITKKQVEVVVEQLSKTK